MHYGYGTETKEAVIGQAHRQKGKMMISVRNMVVRMFGKWPPRCWAEKKVRQYIIMNLRKIIC